MTHLIAPLCLLLLSLALASAQNVEIGAPSQPPSSASNPVDRQFLGIMVESTSWPDYADQTLSQDLIQNIVAKTGTPVIIRVGGTSGDQFVYNASQTLAIVRDNSSDHSLLANITVGPAWMEGFTRIKNVSYVVEVPLARNQLNKTIAFTKAAVQAIGKNNLEAVEIGNEPDLYASVSQQKRPTGYNLSAWVQEFLQYSDAISQNVDLPTGPIYQAGGFAWDPGHSWSPQDAYSLGLSKSDKIKTFAMHYYQTHVGEGNTLRDDLLNHNYTVSRTNTLESFLSYMHADHASVPFVLDEAGDALGSLVPGEPQLDAVLGSALWEVDWLLYLMASSYNRVNMNQCKRCNFASWWTAQNSTPTAPAALAEVRSQYFGLAFVADFLGGNDARAHLTLPLRVTSLYNTTYPYLSTYAGYLNGKLDRYAVVELTEWNMTSTQSRPVRNITLDVPSGYTHAELRRLIGNGTDANATDMSYAGLRYSATNTSGKVVGTTVEILPAEKGKINFLLRASEAGLVTLK